MSQRTPFPFAESCRKLFFGQHATATCHRSTLLLLFVGSLAAVLIFGRAPKAGEAAEPMAKATPAAAAAAEKSKDSADDAQAAETKVGEAKAKADQTAKAADGDDDEDHGDEAVDDNDDADEDAEAEPAAAEENPIADFIKRAFGPARRGKPKSATGKDKSRSIRDTRAALDTVKAGWMRKAKLHLKEQHWEEALEQLQRIIEHPEDSLYRLPDRWSSIRSEAQRMIGELPAEVLDRYRGEFDGLARRLLAEAAGNQALLARVATTYFHTTAGYEATNRLGTWHLDRGEFELSARCFAALWQAHAPQTQDRLWRVKAAYALRHANNSKLATEILKNELAAGQSATVTLGGETRTIADWFAATTPQRSSSSAALAEWPMYYGNPARTGTARGGTPLLLPRWTQPLTQNHSVRAQLNYLVEDLSDQGTLPLPLLFPVMVQDKIVYRTLHGVEVVDATSGRLLWQTDETTPIEAFLGSGLHGISRAQIARRFQLQRNAFMPEYWGGSAEYHPLSNLLFRNINIGTISSDGRQLYVLEDPAVVSPRQPGQAWGWDNNSDDSGGGNTLFAYQLATGRQRWEVGGAADGESFDLPLAGTFFFGPPTWSEHELLVVGERDSEIRLYALSPATGQPVWSQLIGFSDADIRTDIGRRWWSGQPSVGQGVIVCPTTAGWLVAIDRATRSLMWGYPLSSQPKADNNNGNGGSLVPSAALNARWSPTPPIITGNRVLYSPPESQFLYCLNLLDGKLLWRKSRGNSIYVAGVFGSRVVVVDRDEIKAYSLEDGKQSWSIQTAAPSGRGVIVEGHYYLPLATGELWSIDLSRGVVDHKTYLPAGATPLGNLGFYQGLLVSSSVQGITAFEQREAIVAEIASRRQTNANDPWALLREADMAALERRYDDCLKLLDRLAPEELPADLATRYRERRWNTLVASIRSNLESPETAASLKELTSLATQPEEQLLCQRLRAEWLAAAGNFEPAFEQYLALATKSPEAQVPLDETGKIHARHDLWVSGCLRDLWERLPAETRSQLDQRVTDLADKSLQGSLADRQHFLTTFGYHPAAVPVQQKLVEELATRGDFLAAERLLLHLQSSSEPQLAATATERLARLMLEHKLTSDAGWYYNQLQQRYPSEKLADGKTVTELLASLKDSDQLPSATRTGWSDWHADGVQVQRMGLSYSHNNYSQDLSRSGSHVPFFREIAVDLDQSRQRLEMQRVSDGSTYWELPLRAKARTPDGVLGVAQSSAHHLTILYRGVLHSLSPVDRRVLWTHTLEDRLGAQGYYASQNHTPVPRMQLASEIKLPQRLTTLQSGGAAGGMLSLANQQIVCYQGRRRLTVLDSITGDIKWTYDGLGPNTQILGGEDVLYLQATSSTSNLALRSLDGRPCKIDDLDNLLGKTIAFVGKDLILSESQKSKDRSSNKRIVRLQRFDPLSGQTVWTTDISRSTLLSAIDENRLAMLSPDGHFDLLSLHTGKTTRLGTVPAENLKGRAEVFALADSQNIYLLINGRRSYNLYSEGLPYVRASGTMLAFNPVTASLRWMQKISGQNLILERIDQTPFLVFAARKQRKKGRVHYSMLNVMAVDKLTGEQVLSNSSASHSGFRSLVVNPADEYVELRSYNERIRFIPSRTVKAEATEQTVLPKNGLPPRKEKTYRDRLQNSSSTSVTRPQTQPAS